MMLKVMLREGLKEKNSYLRWGARGFNFSNMLQKLEDALVEQMLTLNNFEK